MIPIQDRQLLYEYLMYDLAIRSLQHDLEHMQGLKYANLYIEQYSMVLAHLQQDCRWRYKKLAGKKIRLVKWVKVDEYFSDAILATSGEDAVMRFSVDAIKQNSQDLIRQRLLPVSSIVREGD